MAITSAKRASELHAISVDDLIDHADGITAFVRESFLPKVATEWHVDQPIQFPAIPATADSELHKLCVASSVRHYLQATRSLRDTTGESQLLLCYGNPKQGMPVSKQRVSTWLKELIVEVSEQAGTIVGSVKAHDTRKMASSWAHAARVDPQRICEAATWRSSNMFARHYKLDVLHADRAEMGRRILELASNPRSSTSN
jgi:hypothetical protein